MEGIDIECPKAKREGGPYEVPLEEIYQEEHFGCTAGEKRRLTRLGVVKSALARSKGKSG